MVEVSRNFERSFSGLQAALKEAVESIINESAFNSVRLHILNHPAKHVRLVVFFANGPEEYRNKRRDCDEEFSSVASEITDLIEGHIRFKEIQAFVAGIRREYPSFKWGIVAEAFVRESALVER